MYTTKLAAMPNDLPLGLGERLPRKEEVEKRQREVAEKREAEQLMDVFEHYDHTFLHDLAAVGGQAPCAPVVKGGGAWASQSYLPDRSDPGYWLEYDLEPQQAPVPPPVVQSQLRLLSALEVDWYLKQEHKYYCEGRHPNIKTPAPPLSSLLELFLQEKRIGGVYQWTFEMLEEFEGFVAELSRKENAWVRMNISERIVRNMMGEKPATLA